MNALVRWLKRNPVLLDYVEGASSVLAPEPPPPPRRRYIDSDPVALVADMHAVGRDMRKAMDDLDRDSNG